MLPSCKVENEIVEPWDGWIEENERKNVPYQMRRKNSKYFILDKFYWFV